MHGHAAGAPLARLWVAHWPAGAGGMAPPAHRGLLLDTCQRRVFATLDAPAGLAATAPEAFAGIAAYRFLLEVAAGLRSAVPGETNVFGQFRRAWEASRRTADPDVMESLGPLIARVIRDTRAVREAHLRDIGGASYGGLVRKLLRPAEDEHVLIVGAGDLARSLLPFFRGHAVGVWNRRTPGPEFTAAARIFAPGDGPAAAAWAHHIVLTTPADAGNDGRWHDWLAACEGTARSLVHLGRRRAQPWTWPVHLVARDLDDVFELRRSQDSIRSLQVERARAACRELAGRCGRESGRGDVVGNGTARRATG